MATTIVPVKLTPEELDVLDWMVHATSNVSRSDALRECLLQQASMSGIQYGVISQARDSRLDHPVRVSKHKRKKKRPAEISTAVLDFTRDESMPEKKPQARHKHKGK